MTVAGNGVSNMVKLVGSMGPLRVDIVEELLNVERRTFAEVAAFFEVDYFHAYAFAKQKGIVVRVAKSGRRVPKAIKAEAERLLIETNLPIIEIAKRLGLPSRHSIYLIRQRLQREQFRQVVSQEKSGMSFSEVSQRQEFKRCEFHGKVSIWPCVACEAERFRAQAKANQLKIFAKTG